MMTLPSASAPWTWKTYLAMSRPIVVIVCMLGSSKLWGALTAHTFMALTCRWRSRPQHQKRTHASQQTVSLFDYLIGASEQRLTQKNPGQMSRGLSLVGVQTVRVSAGYPLMDMDAGSRHCREKCHSSDHKT